MQVPCLPLVMAIGRPRHSGRSRCSIEAKKAFMSTSAMALGQVGKGVWLFGVALFIYCDYIQYFL